MDKAPASGAGDSAFESRRLNVLFLCSEDMADVTTSAFLPAKFHIDPCSLEASAGDGGWCRSSSTLRCLCKNVWGEQKVWREILTLTREAIG